MKPSLDHTGLWKDDVVSSIKKKIKKLRTCDCLFKIRAETTTSNISPSKQKN
jgi:hypothetical protein